MKLRLLFALVGGLLLAATRPALASHAQAGQLTYTYVSTAANGDQTYRVRMEYYRDCAAIVLGTPPVITAVNSCGGTARTATLSPVGQPTIGSPYCPSIQATVPCSLNGSVNTNFLNYVTYVYEGSIVLPPAAEWILSFEENARPTVANLTTVGTLRLEARLRSLITPVGGGAPVTVTNSSPIYSSTNLPVAFVYLNQQATVTFTATDPDRTNGQADSLVYSLERPLSGCNAYETYAAYPGAGCVGQMDPLCTTRIINCAGQATTYSAILPLPVANDTIFENGSTVRPACPGSSIASASVRPRFSFNSRQGSFSFTPNRYTPSPSANGLNKYVVVGKVTEYRKIAGRYYEVGSVRRDFLVVVTDGGGNAAPTSPTGTVDLPNSNTSLTLTADTTDVTITTGNYSRIRLTFSDSDNTGPTPASPLQNLTVFTPADINTNLLQGGDIGTYVLTGNGTPSPEATFHFQPGPAGAGTTVLLPLRIEDDGCPIKGVQYKALRLHIINLPQLPRIAVAGQGAGPVAAATVCFGSSVQLLSRISRPDSVLTPATSRVVAQQYSYLWSSTNPDPATNGLPAALNTRDLSVSPTVDTRYTLRMSPVLGFAPGQFVDTTSIVLRGGSPPSSSLPVPVITRSGNVLSSNYATGNQWYRDGTALPGATGQTYLLTATGSYTLVVQPDPTQCTFPPTAPLLITALGSRAALAGTSLSLAPNPTADGRVRVELRGYRQAVSLSVYDLLGRAVQQQQVAAPNPAGEVRQLDLSQQPAGVYLLQVQTKGGMVMRRIVRQ